MSTCKYELIIRGDTGQEVTEAVAELLEAIGGGGGKPAEEEPSAAQATGRKKAPAKQKPAASKKKPAASKKKAEPATEPSADEDEGPTLDDVASAATDLVNALNGDMKRAQELVHAEFKVRRISELETDSYRRFIDWAKSQVELLKDLNGMDDDMPPEAPGQDEDED